MKYEVSRVGKEWDVEPTKSRHNVIVGDPLEVYAVTKLKAIREIAKAIIGIGLIFLIAPIVFGATYIGWTDGSFNELESVWNAVGIIVGIVVGYYFLGST